MADIIAMGAINDRLDVLGAGDDATPTIVMTGGAVCPAGGSEKTKMSTAIRFVCDSSAGKGVCWLWAIFSCLGRPT